MFNFLENLRETISDFPLHCYYLLCSGFLFAFLDQVQIADIFRTISVFSDRVRSKLQHEPKQVDARQLRLQHHVVRVNNHRQFE